MKKELMNWVDLILKSLKGKYVKSLQMHKSWFKEDRNTFKEDAVKIFGSEITKKNPLMGFYSQTWKNIA